MSHQPAISFSIAFLSPFNRAGGRTFDVRQRIMKTIARLFGISSHGLESFRDRLPLTTLDFCDRCCLAIDHSKVVDDFRRAFSDCVSVDSNLIYPEDEATLFGLAYSDDLALFLFDEGLLTNERFHYDFPMEEASSVADIIRLTLDLNSQSEHAVGGSPIVLEDDPWGLDPGVLPRSLGGALLQSIGRLFRTK